MGWTYNIDIGPLARNRQILPVMREAERVRGVLGARYRPRADPFFGVEEVDDGVHTAGGDVSNAAIVCEKPV